MDLTPFIGRKRELDLLTGEWSENKASLMILNGTPFGVRRTTGCFGSCQSGEFRVEMEA